MKLDKLLDYDLLRDELERGYIRVQKHPDHDYHIYNYTHKAATERRWNKATRTCRGLIVRGDGLVLARPFEKFFNVGEAGAADIPSYHEVVVTDKIDGSLAILYPLPNGEYAIATRGSFTSPQAIAATEIWRRRYQGVFDPYPEYTYLFEFVDPGNRIVVDYGDLSDLVYLTAIDTALGTDMRWVAGSHWPGLKTRHIKARTKDAPYDTMADVFLMPPRPGREGVVVMSAVTGERLKIKQQDYIELHKLITGTTERTIWARMVDGDTVDAHWITLLPADLAGWVRDVMKRIDAEVDEQLEKIVAVFDSLTVGSIDRKNFAEKALLHNDSWALFLLWDGRDPRPRLLYRNRPAATTRYGADREEEVNVR